MRRICCLIFAAALLGVLQLSADGQEKKEPTKALPQINACCPPGFTYKHLDGRPIVFVANGAGGSMTLSDNLLDLNSEMGLGLRLQNVPWCRHNAVFEDLIDNQAQLNAATRIACTVTAIRKDCPNVPIFLIGQSAGARIVLAASEMMPPKSVDRVIVLAPAVTCGYDLTNAMRGSRGGIYNLYSSEDGVLASAEEYSKLADGLVGPAAGRVGFRPPSADPKEVAQFHQNVRQLRWTEEFAGSGGHFAWALRHNLKRVVVPLFQPVTVIFEPPALEKKMPAAK